MIPARRIEIENMGIFADDKDIIFLLPRRHCVKELKKEFPNSSRDVDGFRGKGGLKRLILLMKKIQRRVPNGSRSMEINKGSVTVRAKGDIKIRGSKIVPGIF